MSSTTIDQIIEEKLELLFEEKYKLRIFQAEILLRIDSSFGVEETLQDIRSIDGVTVVTALDSLYHQTTSSYLSRIKVKFHPRQDTTTPKTFLKDHLLPSIRSDEIPGCKVIRVAKQPERIE